MAMRKWWRRLGANIWETGFGKGDYVATNVMNKFIAIILFSYSPFIHTKSKVHSSNRIILRLLELVN